MTKKLFITMTLASTLLASCCGNTGKQEEAAMITKQPIEVVDGRFTAEIMHQLGKVGDPQLSPDGSKILYGVGYTSVKENRSNRELFVMNIDGSQNQKITNSAKSENNARWINGGNQIAFLRGGSMWIMDANGQNEREVKGISGFDVADIHYFVLCRRELKCIYA